MNPAPTQPPAIDADVLRQVARGDTRAFERLYDAFSGILFSVALRMLERPEDAEELLQEVFTKIWQEAHHYDPKRGAPLAWAITITRHKAIDRIRSLSRRLKLNDEAGQEESVTPTTVQPPAKQTELRESATAVRVSLSHLPPDVRETIELAYFGGFSHSQIAEKLALPVTTVKSRIRRAMQQLRLTLKNYV
ncbi:sigma-70 family RNA polymerase sigma factor [soil metagenome]